MPPRGKGKYYQTLAANRRGYCVNQNALLIETRLKIKCMLNRFGDAHLHEPMKQIMQLFGGCKWLIEFIVDQAPQNKLEEIHTIIKTEKVKENNETKRNEPKRNESETATTTNKYVIKKGSNPFNKLAKESICHICGYLNKYDINVFKLSSRQIAIVCMAEMNKITIGSINGNNLLHHEHNLYRVRAKNLCQMNRFGKTKKYDFIMQQWAKMYNIPTEYQILFRLLELANCINYVILPSIQNEEYLKLQSKQICVRDIGRDIKPLVYIVCDLRNIVIITANQCGDFKLLNKDKSYELMVLQYYDITTGCLTPVQIVLGERDKNMLSDERLFKYIEYEFVNVNKRSDKWYPKLKEKMKQMFNKDSRKLKIKFVNRRTALSANLFTFQLNYPMLNAIYPREIAINGTLWTRRYDPSKKRYFWIFLQSDNPNKLSYNPWHDSGLIAPWILKYGKEHNSELDIYYDSMVDD